MRIHEVQLLPESPLSERVSFSILKLITFFLGTSLFIILLLFSIWQEYLRIKQFRRHYVHVQICLNRVPMLLDVSNKNLIVRNETEISISRGKSAYLNRVGILGNPECVFYNLDGFNFLIFRQKSRFFLNEVCYD